MDDEDAAIGQHVLAPGRAQLDDALRAVAGITDAQQAWEALVACAIVPPAWASDPARGFRWGPGRRSRQLRPGCALAAHPASPLECAAMAADRRGVETAEALAREVLARLRPWGFEPVDAIAWRIERGFKPIQQRAPRWCALESAVWCAEGGDPAHDAGRRSFPSLPRRADVHRQTWKWFDRDEFLAWRWSVLAAGACVPSDPDKCHGLAASVYGRPFATLPDPFEPLLGIWRLGYVLDGVTRDAIGLVAPALDR